MLFGCAAFSAVSGVAFHNCAFHFLDERTYERRLKIVGISGFTRAHFYGNLAFGFHTQCFVNSHESFGADVPRYVNLGLCVYLYAHQGNE